MRTEQVENHHHHAHHEKDASHAFHKELHKEQVPAAASDKRSTAHPQDGHSLDMGNIWDNTTHAVQHGAAEAGKAAARVGAAVDQAANQGFDAMDKSPVGHVFTHDVCNDNRLSGKLLGVGGAIAVAPIAFEVGTVAATAAGVAGVGLAITGLMNGLIHGKDH